MTEQWKTNAYAEITERYGLKAAQRDKLDAAAALHAILEYAHYRKWDFVAELLLASGISPTNTCPCVHCKPFLDRTHGNGCSGYHCSGSCIAPVKVS